MYRDISVYIPLGRHLSTHFFYDILLGSAQMNGKHVAEVSLNPDKVLEIFFSNNESQ